MPGFFSAHHTSKLFHVFQDIPVSNLGRVVSEALFLASHCEPDVAHYCGNQEIAFQRSRITGSIGKNQKDLVPGQFLSGLVHSDEPVTLRLDSRGPAEVTAADIQPHPDVEVLNGDLPLANINAKGRLAIDITVQQGRGYVSADRNNTSTTIGVIPVDSIYSPVRRVSFEVLPTRVEQSTDFDRLVLEIETDGSITPREALASAGGTLRALVQLVEEMSDEPQGLELGEAVQIATGGPDMDLPIEDLELSERPRNCLKRAQVNSVGELLLKSEDDLLAITNFGQKSLDEVIAKLDERGLTLRNRD